MILSKDLVAASSTPLILSILSIEDSYGYAIIQQVHELSDGELKWADGMLYPILHRMEKKGWIESFWGQANTGRKRKYYRLSAQGTSELKQQQEQWQKLSNMISKLEK
ncbi:PadR family transcriptional regulator [Brumicola pallidula]|jgi:transcriptional regulator|uniref:Transcriptional regulator, PadR-like family n=1 Tax=Brumicola pallidula DSM 14239 = ACAM 615 TaxID=1121922 RepID=K6Y3N3_9ALTE|nr:helix-turn-helix transcriptional regulator [Glaciecola pallidula]GAC27399.1 transcriptional regulator, PadR-like family [Glaciecola pallidula DSM 14239 = ACAM 615]